MNNLTMDGEFRYVIQWFNEWSELQRDDFFPILFDYLTKEQAGVYVNGVVGQANAEKPMSLFQCRIKLFKEWTPKWPEDMKQKLKETIIEIDPKFEDKINNELKGIKANCSGQISNGNINDMAHSNPTVTDIALAALAVVEDTEAALNAVGVLNEVAIISAANNPVQLDAAAGGDHISDATEQVSVNDDVPLVA